MDVADVFGDAFDLRHLPERAEGIRCGPGQQFQTAPEGQPGVAVILRALVAAAVLPVILQKAVQTVCGLLYRRMALFLRGGQQKDREQDVLGTPAGPVAHGLCAVSHPPEVGGEIRRQDAGVQIPLHAAGQPRRGGVQFVLQQIPGQGQKSPGLGGKQLHDGAVCIRQGQLGSIPDIAVVGRQLPCALLTDRPDGIRDGICEAVPMLGTFGAHQCAQPRPAGKVSVLPRGAPPGADEIQPEGKGQCRQRLCEFRFSRLQKTVFYPLRQGLPCGALFCSRKRAVIGQGVR